VLLETLYFGDTVKYTAPQNSENCYYTSQLSIRNPDLVGETDVIFVAHDANRGKDG